MQGHHTPHKKQIKVPRRAEPRERNTSEARQLALAMRAVKPIHAVPTMRQVTNAAAALVAMPGDLSFLTGGAAAAC